MSQADVAGGRKARCVVGDRLPAHKVNPIAVTIIIVVHVGLGRPELVGWHEALSVVQHTAMAATALQLVMIAAGQLLRMAGWMTEFAARVARTAGTGIDRARAWLHERIDFSWSMSFTARQC